MARFRSVRGHAAGSRAKPVSPRSDRPPSARGAARALQIQHIAGTVGKAVEFTVCGGQVPPPAALFQESQPLRMYLLYLDGSGSVRNPTERHFVLAGVAVFERQIYHLISNTDQFVASLGLEPSTMRNCLPA